MDSDLLILTILYWKWKNRQRTHLIKKKKVKRRLWVRPIFENTARAEFGAGANLVAEMILNDKTKYNNFFRMGPEAFEELLSLIGPRIKKVDLYRQTISPALRLSITLRYLASGDSMASLTYLFRVGYSTISIIIAETCKTIWDVLKSLVLLMPDQETWKSVASGFNNKWQFPNCIGAIDGKHVTIQAPPNSGSEFYNYKGSHSIVILAVVDDNYGFSLVDVGAQGRQSDGGIFRNSAIGRFLQSNSSNIPPPASIAEGRLPLPQVIVGDEAFPLLTNLMKPYSSRSGLDIEKSVFNYRLSRARRMSENTFGILSARWRIYRKPIIAKLENIENIIKATICLHNFIIKKYKNCSYMSPDLVDQATATTLVPGSWRRSISVLQPLGRISTNTYDRNAKDIRNEFKSYFNEEGAVPWQWDRI